MERVHGRADKDTEETKTGFNLGVPINTYLKLSTKIGTDVGVSAPSTQAATAPKADDFFIQGGDKYQKGDKQGAIADYNQAIRMNPNYAKAYNNRGNARADLGDKQGAIADYNQAIRINPNIANAYYNRGVARFELGDKQEAITDLHKAADLFRQQGNTQLYQQLLELLRQLQR